MINILVRGMGQDEKSWNEVKNQLNNNGFISTTLGNRIMRVESVPLFILSVINYEYME